MVGEIDFRFSGVNPPAVEPKRSIYRDLPNLPDPVLLGLTIRYFNNDAVTLYFKVNGEGTGYTFTETTLASLLAGTDTYVNINAFASRAKPTVETDEIINVTLYAYSDAGYTALKWTFTRSIHVVFINSNDPSYTVVGEYNFDDGTVQGWAVVSVLSFNGSQGVATDYVLSNPYSLRGIITSSLAQTTTAWYHHLTFNTPAGTVYAIVNVRGHANGTACYFKYLQIKNGNDILIQLGIDEASNTEILTKDIWMRIVLPIPASSSVDLRVQCKWRLGTTSSRTVSINIDDVRIVSK